MKDFNTKKIIKGEAIMKKMMLLIAVLMIMLSLNARTIRVNPGNGNGIDIFDTIQEAINAAHDGYTIVVSSGIFEEGTIVVDKNVSIVGDTTTRTHSIIYGRLVFQNLTNATPLNHMMFKPHPADQNNHGLVLINSTPRIDDVIFDNEGSEFTTDIDVYGLTTNNSLVITNSVFSSFYGINFNGGTLPFSELIVDNCNFTYNARRNSQNGLGINFIGTNIEITNSEFAYHNNVLNRPAVVSIAMQRPAREGYIDISNNKFLYNRILNWGGSGFREALSIVNVTGINPYEINIERNIFRTDGDNTNYFSIELILLSATPSIRAINNTDVVFRNGILCANYSYSFLRHSGHLFATNNLLMGNISTNSNSSINNISYTWFVNQRSSNFPANSTTTEIFYGNPQIRYDTLEPRWEEWVKSALIDMGHPTLNGEFWYDDPTNQDPNGTRQDIGAVPSLLEGHGQYRITLPRALPLTASRMRDYSWICFPYLDKLYKGLIDGIYPADRLNYNLNIYQNNKLLDVLPPPIYLESMHWQYSLTEFGALFWNDPDWNFHQYAALDSRFGYKVEMKPGQSKDIITGGFLAGTMYNPNIIMTLPPNQNNSEMEIWVGYFKKQSEKPLIALQQIEHVLTEIKTQDWAMWKTASGIWWGNTSDPLLNFGEAVALVFKNNTTPIDFTWQISPTAQDEPYIHPEVQYFSYVEEIDYTPIFVFLPPDLAIEGIGELGMYINDECYGAEVIMGDVVQINAYIIDLNYNITDVDFLFYEYGSRAGARSLGNYMVLNQTHDVFQSRTLDLNNGDSVHVISFKGEEHHNSYESNNKSFLEGNYPNPFNPTTTISYNIGQAGNVKLQVFNIRGQVVRTLVDEVQNAGRHSIVWNGDDSNSNNVASGIYFYRLETSAGVEVHRMLLMK
ncbi:MAG: T9SS type A sorting domain-containing protein [Candidatus Cloacimonetes bacterium]|nr:T9SS type A sorting domain-containing protein [Candidatus Cloacimonadota bacterium]